MIFNKMSLEGTFLNMFFSGRLPAALCFGSASNSHLGGTHTGGTESHICAVIFCKKGVENSLLSHRKNSPYLELPIFHEEKHKNELNFNEFTKI